YPGGQRRGEPRGEFAIVEFLRVEFDREQPAMEPPPAVGRERVERDGRLPAGQVRAEPEHLLAILREAPREVADPPRGVRGQEASLRGAELRDVPGVVRRPREFDLRANELRAG